MFREIDRLGIHFYQDSTHFSSRFAWRCDFFKSVISTATSELSVEECLAQLPLSD